MERTEMERIATQLVRHHNVGVFAGILARTKGVDNDRLVKTIQAAQNEMSRPELPRCHMIGGHICQHSKPHGMERSCTQPAASCAFRGNMFKPTSEG